MTAPTSGQLRLAMSKIRPAWGFTSWPILETIAAHTIDLDLHPDAILEVGQATLGTRLEMSQNAVGARLKKLISQGVLETFGGGAGSQARLVRIEGDFNRWQVPWRGDRTKVLLELQQAVARVFYGGSQRCICARFHGGSQTVDDGEVHLPVYRIVGDFVIEFGPNFARKPSLAREIGGVSARKVGPERPSWGPHTISLSSSTNYSSNEEEEVVVTDGVKAVLAALTAVTGEPRFWGPPLANIVTHLEGLEDVRPVVDALHRERPPKWPDAIRLVIRTAAAAHERASGLALASQPVELPPVDPSARDRIRELHTVLRMGRMVDIPDEEPRSL